jgi:serine/threonine protein kinase
VCLDYLARCWSFRIGSKPNNVIVGPGGVVTLLDFGLARRRGESLSLDQAMGTPPYTPPEQWAGRPLDERADVYALAVTLGELFDAAGVLALRRVLARVSAQAPEDRLASATTMRRALDVARRLDRERRRARPVIVVDMWTILAWSAMLVVLAVVCLR